MAINKALLLNLGVFLADNNVRRNVQSFTFNYASGTASVTQQQLTLGPGETFTWTTPVVMLPSAATLIVTSAALEVDLTFSASQGETVIPASYSCKVSRLHFTDQSVSSVVLQNSGTAPAQVVFLQC